MKSSWPQGLWLLSSLPLPPHVPLFIFFPPPTEMPLQFSWGPEVRRVGCFCCQASCAWEQRQTSRQRRRRGQRGGSLLLAWHRLILTQLKSGQKWFNYGIGTWSGWKRCRYFACSCEGRVPPSKQLWVLCVKTQTCGVLKMSEIRTRRRLFPGKPLCVLHALHSTFHRGWWCVSAMWWNVIKYIYLNTALKYKFEVLCLNVFIVCNFILLLHHISEAPFHLLNSFSQQLLCRLEFFIPFLSSEDQASPNVVIFKSECLW